MRAGADGATPTESTGTWRQGRGGIARGEILQREEVRGGLTSSTRECVRMTQLKL